MDTKQAKACCIKIEPALAGFVSVDPDFSRGQIPLLKNQPASAGFVSLDPDFESGANSSSRQVVNSTTDPRSVSVKAKQAKSLWLAAQTDVGFFPIQVRRGFH